MSRASKDRIHIPSLLFLALISAGLWAGAHPASAACDCANSHTAPWCTTANSATVSYTSPYGATVSIALGDNGTGNTTYTCGQYANGDYWIVGKGSTKGVEVVSTSPALDYSGGQFRSGWDINPEFPGDNRVDGRSKMGLSSLPDQTLPRVFRTAYGPVSFVKAKGKDTIPSEVGGANPPCDGGTRHRACIEFLGAWTFVDSVPDSDGDNFTADEFRPTTSLASGEKPGPFRIDAGFEARAQAFPGLDRTLAPAHSGFTFAAAKNRYRWPFYAISANKSKGLYFYTMSYHAVKGPYCCTYGGDRARANLSFAMRFLLDDFGFPSGTANVSPNHRNDDEQALINYVQSGIDTFGDALMGQVYCVDNVDNGTAAGGGTRTSPISGLECYGNFGSIPNGPKVRALLAAHLLGDSRMKAWVAGTADMDVIKAGNAPYPGPRSVDHFVVDNEVYWGADGRSYYGARIPSACHTGAEISGGVARQPGLVGDATCACNTTKVKSYMGQNANQHPYHRLIVKMLGLEELFNQDAFLDFAYGWAEGGRGPGHTGGSYCPPSVGGTGNSYSNVSYRSSLGEDMWDAFKDLSGTAPPESPPPSEPPPAGSSQPPPPLQLD